MKTDLFLLQITYADLVFFNTMPAYKYIEVDLPYDKYPALKQLQDRVGEEPKIAEWIKKRPVTEMWTLDRSLILENDLLHWISKK